VNFGEAVEAMKQGKTITCRRWQKEGSTVVGARLMAANDQHDEFIAWMLPDGTWEPMTYSHKNILAEDWTVLPNEGP
jgi:hypothetical protein